MTNSNNNGNSLVFYLLRTAIGVVLLGCAAWGAYVNSSINALRDDVAELKTAFAKIDGKLDIVVESLRRGR